MITGRRTTNIELLDAPYVVEIHTKRRIFLATICTRLTFCNTYNITPLITTGAVILWHLVGMLSTVSSYLILISVVPF